MSSNSLSIGELVARTGVSEPTLRMWERRHGFPEPARTASGHRRYTELHVEQVRDVLAARQDGLSLTAAIARATTRHDPLDFSPFATLRRRHPELEPQLVRKSALVMLSHAIEDESLARAEHPLLFGCFQRERFYRQSQARWRELAQGAQAAVVFADFERVADGHDGPIEVPVGRTSPIAREWTLASYGTRSAICLTAREQASSNTDSETPTRSFEMVWTVDPHAVRTVIELCVEATAATVPDFRARVAAPLTQHASGSERERLGLATAVINRTLARLH